MDKQIADLKQAQACVDDATRHILNMRTAIERHEGMPRSERMQAAEKLNRASEIIRRSYDD